MAEVPVLGGSVLMARYQQAAAEASTASGTAPKYPRTSAFLQFWRWIVPYVRHFVLPKVAYRSYLEDRFGVFRLETPEHGVLRIGVASDWATGTLESELVAENIAAGKPDCTIHLGDVYYVGGGAETRENCRGETRGGYAGVSWPLGSQGAFALMGNHEMYSGGWGFFRHFLPILGLRGADGAIRQPQAASYFCLETDHWLIFGLDTGYHSGGVPALGSLPWAAGLGFLDIDGRFDRRMMAWLERTVARFEAGPEGKKSVLVLTHHPPFSRFEPPFERPVSQLAELAFFRGREMVWLHGHEHRLAIYQRQRLMGALTLHSRCVGHGGMPVLETKVTKPEPSLLYYDPRLHPIDDQDEQTLVGFNGHVNLCFEGRALTIEYCDIQGESKGESQAAVRERPTTSPPRERPARTSATRVCSPRYAVPLRTSGRSGGSRPRRGRRGRRSRCSTWPTR